MYFGSPLYLASILLLVSVTAILWVVLRKRSRRTQQTVVLVLLVVNTLQHLLKSWIYPQYFGMGFTLLSTAYNVCAVLIMAAPFVLLWGNRFLKNFLFFIGSAAGVGAIAMPYWYFGVPVQELGWRYFRFYLCHALLFVSCLLPLLLGLHKPSYREFWQVGLGFLLTLCIILVNNVIFMSIGLWPDENSVPLYEQLLSINPCMMMGPKKDLEWLVNIIKPFSPDVFLGDNPAGRYAPILWYAVPVYVGISVLTFVLFALIDRKAFSSDVRHLRGS